MRAYILIRTQSGTSKEVMENLRRKYGQSFIQGSTVYGWYDVLVELEIPSAERLNEVVDDLMQSHLDIVHVETVVERTRDIPSFSQCPPLAT